MVSSKDSKPKTEKSSSTDFILHKVSVGETLYSIARKYGVLLEELKEWNNLSGNKIAHKQELKIYDNHKEFNVASKDLRESVEETSNSGSKVRALANVPSTKNKKLDLNFSNVLGRRDSFDISALVVLDPKIPIFEVNGDFIIGISLKK